MCLQCRAVVCCAVLRRAVIYSCHAVLFRVLLTNVFCRHAAPHPSCYTFGSPPVLAHEAGGGSDAVLEVLRLPPGSIQNFVLEMDPVPRALLSVDPSFELLSVSERAGLAVLAGDDLCRGCLHQGCNSGDCTRPWASCAALPCRMPWVVVFEGICVPAPARGGFVIRQPLRISPRQTCSTAHRHRLCATSPV